MRALPFLAAVCSACATPQRQPMDVLAAPSHQLDDSRFDALYAAYVRRFIAGDGRVVDPQGGGRTTSEGQAYALVHALVAGDQATFRRVLAWTDTHLTSGGARLPAWLWARGAVVDLNSAADADLWMAWALLEAGRVWSDPVLDARGKALAALAAAQEVADLPGLGPMLLPGPAGFRFKSGGARLNPSYLVLPQLRRLALADPRGPWSAIAANAARVLVEAAPHGFAPDWIIWNGALAEDRVSAGIGSYDAIRVPLWAGLIADDEPLRGPLQQAASGLLRFFAAKGYLPEVVEVREGIPRPAAGPAGFTAALIPLACALGDTAAARALRAQVARSIAPDGSLGQPPTYYDQNLALFALAFDEGRARFDADGRLLPGKALPCAP